MAKTPIEEVVRAVEAVRTLTDLADRHDIALKRILDRLDMIEQRLDALSSHKL